MANTSPPLAATASPPATTSPPTDAHVPLGLLVAYEGMICSPAPEPTPHQRPLVPTPPKRYAVSALPERPQVSARAPPGVRAARAPPVSTPVPAPHERPQVPAPSESQPEPAPTEGPPDVVDFPKNIWGSGAICPWPKWRGPKAKATETPGPPWPFKPPASPWRPPMSPSWTSLQGIPPPWWICYGADAPVGRGA